MIRPAAILNSLPKKINMLPIKEAAIPNEINKLPMGPITMMRNQNQNTANPYFHVSFSLINCRVLKRMQSQLIFDLKLVFAA